MSRSSLVPVSGGVVLGRDDQTTALLRTFVDGFDDINELLLVFEDPVEFVVVASTEITHHMFVAEEEHESDRIIELVHLLEVGDLVEVANVDDGEVLDSVCDLVEYFILTHTVWVPVAAKANHHETFVFSEDGLVDVPGSDEVRNDDGTHDGWDLSQTNERFADCGVQKLQSRSGERGRRRNVLERSFRSEGRLGAKGRQPYCRHKAAPLKNLRTTRLPLPWISP